MTGPQGNYGMGRFHGRFQGFIATLVVILGVYLWVNYKEKKNKSLYLN